MMPGHYYEEQVFWYIIMYVYMLDDVVYIQIKMYAIGI